MVLNPNSVHYNKLRAKLGEVYEDSYWGEDAIYMERNSRDFQRRINIINKNTLAIAQFLRERSCVYNGCQGTTAEGQDTPFVIKEVYYPKWVTNENFEICRNHGPEDVDGDHADHNRTQPYPGGYGGLFSCTFTNETAAQVFFDTLRCEKGPSLGKLTLALHVRASENIFFLRYELHTRMPLHHFGPLYGDGMGRQLGSREGVG
jgi:cystathionine gamma-synthase